MIFILSGRRDWHEGSYSIAPYAAAIMITAISIFDAPVCNYEPRHRGNPVHPIDTRSSKFNLILTWLLLPLGLVCGFGT
jgi:hypothetical protein